MFFCVCGVGWGRFSKIHSHRRAGQRTPQNMKIPKCLDLIGNTMVYTLFTWKFNAQSTLDAFKQVPDLFRMAFQFKAKEQIYSGSCVLHVGVYFNIAGLIYMFIICMCYLWAFLHERRNNLRGSLTPLELLHRLAL